MQLLDSNAMNIFSFCLDTQWMGDKYILIDLQQAPIRNEEESTEG